MRTLTIEINDASIAVARGGKVVALEPGCAVASDEGIAFGQAALRMRRLRPHQANDRYWADLSVEALPRPLPGVKSAADLAHAQLQGLWERHRGDAGEVLLAVPGSLDRRRLSLLLGIADACGIPVRGLVDSAAAASPCEYPGWDTIHVEAQLHGIGLTRLRSADGVVAESYEAIYDSGVARLWERWARRIAAAFVAQTRFDPLSDGKTEQRLFDALPGWLEALDRTPVTTFEFEFGGMTRRIRFSREQLVSEAAEVYERLAQSVGAARRAGQGLAVSLGPVLAGLPGAAQRLGRISGVRVVRLEAGSGALGALASADDVRSARGRVALVTSLRWREPPEELPPLRPGELAGPAAEATHLLCRGTAHPIPDCGLHVRVDEAGEFSVLTDANAERRGDVVLRRCQDGLLLEQDGLPSLLVNGEPARPGVTLASGDRLSVVGCLEAAQLIAVVDDGT